MSISVPGRPVMNLWPMMLLDNSSITAVQLRLELKQRKRVRVLALMSQQLHTGVPSEFAD